MVRGSESGTATPAPAATSPGVTNVPLTWGDLHLRGKLVFSGAELEQGNPVPRIQILDLGNGQLSTIMISPGLSWIYYMSASAATGKIALSYAPSPGYGTPGQQALYVLPLDGSTLPQLAVDPPSADDLYLQAEWSPDGNYLYYVHSTDLPQTADQLYPIYEIFRIRYPGGTPEKVAEDAFWPRLSGNSNRLLYVSSDPADGKNSLFVANADGSGSHRIGLQGPNVPDIIDAPLFTPDGESILFSAPSPLKVDEPSWLERLLGIQVAEAHTVPSDWWSVPVTGGIPTQLTHISSPLLFASSSPDGAWIASYSGSGLFVMKPDGTRLTALLPDEGGLAGMVNWIP